MGAVAVIQDVTARTELASGIQKARSNRSGCERYYDQNTKKGMWNDLLPI